MQKCLNKEETGQLFDLNVDNFALGSNPSESETLFYDCINWQIELTCLTYFLAHIFERKSKQGVSPNFLISQLQDFFSIQERIWISIQEFDDTFIDYLYRHSKDETLSLEETLIQIQDWLSEYRYG